MNIYLTWHLPTHGIHYTKNILAAFWNGRVNLGKLSMATDGLNQDALEAAFEGHAEGFQFDKVYYLYPDQEVQDHIHTRSPKKKWDALKEDQLLKKSATYEYWQKLIDVKHERLQQDLVYLENEVKSKHPEIHAQMLKEYWRVILDYPIEDQLWWFQNMSNVKDIYNQDRFEAVNLSKQRENSIKDMRDYLKIGQALKTYLGKIVRSHPGAQFIVNISLGSYETQVVWFILAEARILPKNTRFIAVYDKKDDPHATRYKDFTIKEVRTDLLDQLRGTFELFQATNSKERQLSNLKMQTYLNTGFSILLLGPRGVGKSKMVRENVSREPGSIIEANCAGFANDLMAESQFFGHTKGAFPGASAEKDGLFQQANGRILFLDEIHNLSKSVQAKLMTALQTDHENMFHIKKLGGKTKEKVSFGVIMASNRTIAQLREDLLPEFFDRIAQHVIEIPSLAETAVDREDDWKAIWKQLNFDGEAPIEPEMMRWMKLLPLAGNYRDLQKIAIYYNTFQSFSDNTRMLLDEKSAFEFARSEYEKYHQENSAQPSLKFDPTKTPVAMVRQFKYELAKWSEKQFGSVTAAAAHFQGLGEKTTRKTLHDWLGYRNTLG